jgi:hypothetical protein
MWWIYILISIVLSLLFVPRLTSGGSEIDKPTEETPKSENDIRIMKPVVSQTCVSQPSINQMLSVDPEAVPGMKSSIWPSDNLHYFDNTEIVNKLCGPAITSGAMSQWKNVENIWQDKYSESAIRARHIKFNDEGENLRKIKPASDSICPGYFHNPVEFCKKNPDQSPCPNFWIENKEKFMPAATSADMRIPDLKKH